MSECISPHHWPQLQPGIKNRSKNSEVLRVREPEPEMEVLMKARIDDWLLSSLVSQWSDMADFSLAMLDQISPFYSRGHQNELPSPRTWHGATYHGKSLGYTVQPAGYHDLPGLGFPPPLRWWVPSASPFEWRRPVPRNPGPLPSQSQCRSKGGVLETLKQ